MSWDIQTARTWASVRNSDLQLLRQGSTRVLIQKTSSRRYLGIFCAWTTDRERAIDFRSRMTALLGVQQLNLVGVQLVFTCGNEILEVVPIISAISV